MYICTVTGQTSDKLVGNIQNRGLSHEYIYVDIATMSPRTRTIISFLLGDLRDCINYPHGFGSGYHLTIINDLHYVVSHPYEDITCYGTYSDTYSTINTFEPSHTK